MPYCRQLTMEESSCAAYLYTLPICIVIFDIWHAYQLDIKFNYYFFSCSYFIIATLRSRCGRYIFVLWFLLSSFFPFPRLISVFAEWMTAILPHVMWPCANLECRSEMCCTRLAENTGCKNHAKIRHDTTGDHLQ